MGKVQKLPLIIAFLLLNACAQSGFQIMAAKVKTALELTITCYSEVGKSPPAVNLKNKLIIDASNYDIRLLTLRTYASSDDISNIIKLRENSKNCRVSLLKNLSKGHPNFVLVMANAYRENDLITADILEKNITFAEANRKSLDLQKRLEEKWKKVWDELVSQYNINAQIQAQSYRSAGNALQKWAEQQRQTYQSTTTTTNCYYMGTSIMCTTWQ